jgi:hypothetical protein
MAQKKKAVDTTAGLVPAGLPRPLTGKAAELIIAAQAGPASLPFPPAALAELRKVCEYNDGASFRSRVTCDHALEMLQEMGVPCASRTALNHACRKHLKRSSFGNP